MTRWGWATWTLLLLLLATTTQGATAVALFVMAVLTGAAAIYTHVMTMLVRKEMERILAERESPGSVTNATVAGEGDSDDEHDAALRDDGDGEDEYDAALRKYRPFFYDWR